MLTDRASNDCAAAAALASLVEQWGYPRKVSAREITDGTWVTDLRAIVWFITPGIEQRDRIVCTDAEYAALCEMFEGVLCVHGIADPGYAGQAFTHAAERLLCDIARSLGAKKLYSLIPLETPQMPVRAMRRYLRRYGWVEDAFGSFKLL
jgi:hypothetical protein